MPGPMPRATSWPRLFCQAAVPLLLSTCLSTPVFAQESTIETVTVTAQKREQNVQDVPVSMTVLGGQQIANLQTRDLKALQNYIPNLYVARTGVNDVVYIRGFGSGVNNIAFDMDVSIYQDGVYGGRSAQFTAPFFDVDRIEVLRGPQGALFGKNTAAGAISIITAGPTDTFEAKGTVSYDFIQKGPELNGYIAGPISDTLGPRLAVKYANHDGFLKNAGTGRDDPHTEQELVRLTLAYNPVPALDITGKFEYGNFAQEGGTNKSGYLDRRSSFSDRRYAAVPYGASPYPEYNGITTTAGSVTANYRIGDHTLTSVTGYSTFHTSRLSAYDETNPDGSVVPNTNNLYANGFPEKFRQFSQEIRLASPEAQPFEYIIGAYYDSSDYNLHQDSYYQGVVGGLFTGHQFTDFHQSSSSFSVFGQGTYHLADNFRVIGSLRYSTTVKSAQFSSGTASGVALNPITPPVAGHLGEDSFDPSVTLQYDAEKHVMFYATYGRGSKSGGFVSNTYGMVADRFSFRPERSTNYEIGVKSQLADGRVLLNVSLYNTIFKDLQQSAYDSNARTFITRNAASATGRGLEATATWLPIDNLELSLSAAYLDAKFDDFPGAQCLADDPITVCDSTNPASIAAHNIAGHVLQFASKWTGNATVHHTWFVGGDYKVDTTVTGLLRSKYYMSDNFSNIYGLQPTVVKWDARIQFGDVNDVWSIAILGKNLTNQKTVADAIRFPPSITTVARSINWMDDYRSVSIEGTYRF